ncbi:hypothetical protein VitviT2T_005282 [Vitis vinifera]|uniref:Uncharacterized protein n=1 Tax=Vitis vinifera TaxID=29760 RepID=A0ABY9BSU5_VITVI|nr:hypothetical protein VitviT2T_005282 [Vitis vinifera]
MIQKALATQSALSDTTPQASPHDKIIVPDPLPIGNMHRHKTGPISTKEITMEVPGRPNLNFIANVPIGAPVQVV